MFMRPGLLVIPALLFATFLPAEAAQLDRITAPIDGNQTVVLTGSVHSKAQPQFDQGAVDPSMSMEYITMLMQPSAKQRADLHQLLAQQQDRSSPSYHKWLIPEQYADRFGLSRNDVRTITTWLQSQGFSIVQVARGRDWIAFSGTPGLVEHTFHTQIHYFNVDDELHFANATEISIPEALEGVVSGFGGLNDFAWKPMGLGRSSTFFPIIFNPFYDLLGNNQLAPGDIATIYNITQ